MRGYMARFVGQPKRSPQLAVKVRVSRVQNRTEQSRAEQNRAPGYTTVSDGSLAGTANWIKAGRRQVGRRNDLGHKKTLPLF